MPKQVSFKIFGLFHGALLVTTQPIFHIFLALMFISTHCAVIFLIASCSSCVFLELRINADLLPQKGQCVLLSRSADFLLQYLLPLTWITAFAKELQDFS